MAVSQMEGRLTEEDKQALRRAIPRISLTPELKLCYAIFGERLWEVRELLVDIYCHLYPIEGDWQEYKEKCVQWVVSAMQGAITEATEALSEPLATILDQLIYRERRVISLRFGFADGRSRTLEETGKEFGVSRERVRQIEAKTLRKLRHPSRTLHIKGKDLWTYMIKRIFAECERMPKPPGLFVLWEYDSAFGEAERDSQKKLVKQLEERVSYLEALIKKAFPQPITELDLSSRVINILTRARHWAFDTPTVGEVALLSERDRIEGLGYRGIKELKDVLQLDDWHHPARRARVVDGKVALVEGHPPTVDGVAGALNVESRHELEARILTYFQDHPDEVYRPPQIRGELVSKIGWPRGPNSLYQFIIDLASSRQVGRLMVPPYVFYGSHRAIEGLRKRLEEKDKEGE